MALYVREYDWMWTQLGLSLAECRVFAYIYGLTNKRTETGVKGYRGSKRQLATSLGLDCGATKRILDSLEEIHLIVCTDGLWQSVVSGNESVVSDNVSVATDNTPTPPINYINKEMEKEINTRANLRDAIPQTPSFLDLKKIFLSQGGKSSDLNEPKALEAWSQATPIKRRRLLEAVQSGAHFRRCLDWLIADFPEPQPEFLSGEQQERNWKTGIEMIQVKYNGHFLICTPQTQQDFDLEYVKPWPKKED